MGTPPSPLLQAVPVPFSLIASKRNPPPKSHGEMGHGDVIVIAIAIAIRIQPPPSYPQTPHP